MEENPKGLWPPGYRIRNVLPKGEGKFVEVSCDSTAGGFPAEEAVSGGGEGEDAVRKSSSRLPMRLFPGGKSVRVRRVSEDCGQRVVAIKGAARSSLVTGAVLIPEDWPVIEGREALFFHDGEAVPAEPVAVLGGPDPHFNTEGFFGRGRLKIDGAYISVQFSQPFPLLPGGEYTFPGKDGGRRSLTLLWVGQPDAGERRRLEKSGLRRPNPHPDAAEVYGRLLYTFGYVWIPPILFGHNWPEASCCGRWVVLGDRRKVLERKILKLASRPGGADEGILRLPGCPDGLIVSLAAEMKERGDLNERGGWYFPPGNPPLSPFHRGWLGKIEAAGAEGIRIRMAASGADKEALAALVRSGLVMGGEAVLLSRKAYDEAAAVILGEDGPGSRFSLADARSRLGGSRAVTLEVLAVMEDEGRLIRAEDGEERVVL